MKEPNGWSNDAKLVLHRLDKIDQELRDIEKRLRHIEGKMWVLQTKAAFIGSIAAMGVTVLLRYI
jgi:hypothetical protein|tara:strand:+ start:2185 stop:2379 length:195 start_codon:yes stop_codon:yes gene_type:complete